MHDLLDHTAFPRAVGRPHSASPRRWRTTQARFPDHRPKHYGVIARRHSRSRFPFALHTRLEALCSGGLCCPRRHRSYGLLRLPLGAPPLHRVAAYRFRCYRTPRVGSPRPSRRCRDGSLLFRDRLCNRSAPFTPTGSLALLFQVLHAVHGLRPGSTGSTPALSPLSQGGFTTLQVSSSYGPVACSPP